MAWSGLVARTLVPLAAGTILLLGAATAVMYRSGLERGRAEILHDLHQRAGRYNLREGALFRHMAAKARHFARILAQRWAEGGPVALPPPLDGEGSRRRVPGPDDEPVASFMTARVAENAAAMHAVGIVEAVVEELGLAWAEGFTGLSIAVPGQWLVTYGEDHVALVKTLLPDDPVVFDSAGESQPDGHGVIWRHALYEPAAGTWSVAAEMRLPTPTGDTAYVRLELALPDLLARARKEALPGSSILVVDADQRLLVSSREGTTHEPGLPLDVVVPGIAALLRANPVAPGETRVIENAADRWWLAVTTLPGPGWQAIAILPHVRVDAESRAGAAGVMRVGLILIALQLVGAAVVLHSGVSRPLRRLVEAAGRLARGERGLALTSHRGDEVGELSRAFERMDRAIAASESNLRTAVDVVRERESFARALVASAADAVVVIEDGRIIDINPRALELFAADVVGFALTDLAPADQADGRPSRLVLGQGCSDAAHYGPQYLPWIVRRADGSEVETEIGLARLDLPGHVRHLLVLRDVTERNRLEEQLRQAQRLEAVGQLAGGVAHDFNNVLTAIIGSAELLRGQDPPPERREALLRTIVSAAERAAGLTSTLLDFARAKRRVTIPIDVHLLITETVALLERSIDKRIRLSINLAAPRARVVGDTAQLQNALLNLGLNARDAMPAGGEIHIATREVFLNAQAAGQLRGDAQPGDHLEVLVSDTGSGIPTAQVDRIFEPFYTTKPVGKGTGLGLATVHRTVCDHHGGLAVESAPESGTKFRIYLPLTTQETEVHGSGPHAAMGQGTILVVDDEPDVRGVAVAHLSALGFVVFEAEDGPQALEVYTQRRDQIDVVILDMEMPGMRGSDCLRALHAIDGDVAAILCSGFAREEDESWRDAGFVAAVAKPYRISELRRAIERALAKRGKHG